MYKFTELYPLPVLPHGTSQRSWPEFEFLRQWTDCARREPPGAFLQVCPVLGC